MWWGYGMHGWGWYGALMMGGLLLLVAAAVVAVVVLLTRAGSGGTGPAPGTTPHPDGMSEADRLLDARFARGEIDEQEYRQRKAVLHGG